MTPEQKRIVALENLVLDLVTVLEEARIGFGERFAARIRTTMRQNQEAHRMTRPKTQPPQPTPPAAPVEGAEAA